MEAAASPKDVIILVDRSGSMTGQRRDIAKHVVTNILDTLGNNDFVNVMTFADTVEEIVPCFEDSLVQVKLSFFACRLSRIHSGTFSTTCVTHAVENKHFLQFMFTCVIEVNIFIINTHVLVPTRSKLAFVFLRPHWEI